MTLLDPPVSSPRGFRTNPLFCPLLTLCLISGCSPKKIEFSSGDTKADVPQTSDSTVPETPAAIVDAEGVEVPSPIVGSLLVCAVRKQPTTDDLKSDLGCRLNEVGTNTKLDISAYQYALAWSSNLPDHVSIDPKTTLLPWHAIYSVTGESVAQIQETTKALRIVIQWTASTRGPVGFHDQALVDILRPIGIFGDTTAPVTLDGIDPNDPSNPLSF